MAWQARLRADVRAQHDEGRHATWMELFFDLVFVVIIARLTHHLLAHPSWTEWAIVALLFYPVFLMGWAAHTTYANRFSMDDGIGQGTTLILMGLALVYATGAEDGLHGNMNLVVIAYLGTRLLLWFNWARVNGFEWLGSTPRTVAVNMFGYADLAIWSASAFAPQPTQQLMWVAAIFLQMIQTLIVFGTGRLADTKADNHHLPERYGLLVIIALGESIVALAAGLTHTVWDLTSSLAAGAALLMIASIWWLYFGFLEAHIIGKADMRNGVAHTYGHFVIIVGLMTLAAGLGRAIPGDGGIATMTLLGGGPLLIVGALHGLDHFQAHRPLRAADHARVLAAVVGLALFVRLADRLPVQAALVLLSGLFGAYVLHVRTSLDVRHGVPDAAVAIEA